MSLTQVLSVNTRPISQRSNNMPKYFPQPAVHNVIAKDEQLEADIAEIINEDKGVKANLDFLSQNETPRSAIQRDAAP